MSTISDRKFPGSKFPPDNGGANRLFRRLQIALPIATGLALFGLLAFLLFHDWEEAEPSRPQFVTRPPAPENSDIQHPATPGGHPIGTPEEPDIRPVAPGTGLKRWNIDPLPEGWDPELAKALAEIFEEIDYDVSSADAYMRAGRAIERLDAFLAELGPDALPTLAAILNAESFFINRRHVIQTIGALGPESENATFMLRDYFVKRMGNIQARSELLHLVRAMGTLQNQTAFDVMAQMVDDKGIAPDYRARFIVALGEHPRRTESIPMLVDKMVTGEQFAIRNYSAQALGKIATPDLLPDLYTAYDRERYWVAKQTILGSIGKVGHPNSVPFLENVARSAKESGVRLSAAGALRRIGTPYAMAVLGELAHTEPHEGVRSRIMRWAPK